MLAICFPFFFFVHSLKIIVLSTEHTTDWHLLWVAAPLRANISPAYQGGDRLCLPLPTGADRRQTEGPLLFLLWFLAASARFLHVYHCNQQARPAVSQAAWNKAAWTAEHKVGEAFLLGYWEGRICAFSLSSVSFPLFVIGGQFVFPLVSAACIISLSEGQLGATKLVLKCVLTPYTIIKKSAYYHHEALVHTVSSADSSLWQK